MNMEEDFWRVLRHRLRSPELGARDPMNGDRSLPSTRRRDPRDPKAKAKPLPLRLHLRMGQIQNIEVDDGNNDERGLDGKTRPKTPEAPSKRRKTTLHGIPVRMELKDNPGAGNCLFAAVADALEAQGRSKRSPAEIRNLTVTHLRTHARSYEGFWKGDAPSAEGADMKVKGFAEYLRLLARDGAWGGSIEVPALAATLAQPIFGAVGPAKATAAPIGHAADRGGVRPRALWEDTERVGGPDAQWRAA